jgi:hypothetical protein
VGVFEGGIFVGCCVGAGELGSLHPKHTEVEIIITMESETIWK